MPTIDPSVRRRYQQHVWKRTTLDTFTCRYCSTERRDEGTRRTLYIDGVWRVFLKNEPLPLCTVRRPKR